MKMMKKMALVLALVLAFAALTACSGSKSVDGKWKMTNISGEAMNLGMESVYVEQMLSSGLLEFTFDFSNGTLTMGLSALGETQTETCDYTVDGDKITIEGTEMTYKINGNKMTLDAEEGTITLERVK